MQCGLLSRRGLTCEEHGCEGQRGQAHGKRTAACDTSAHWRLCDAGHADTSPQGACKASCLQGTVNLSQATFVLLQAQSVAGDVPDNLKQAANRVGSAAKEVSPGPSFLLPWMCARSIQCWGCSVQAAFRLICSPRRTPGWLGPVIRCWGLRYGCVCAQATGKAEKQVDKATDKVGSAAKEVSRGIGLLVALEQYWRAHIMLGAGRKASSTLQSACKLCQAPPGQDWLVTKCPGIRRDASACRQPARQRSRWTRPQTKWARQPRR